MKLALVVLRVLPLFAVVLAPGGASAAASRLSISSPAFAPSGAIPSKHTCEGEDVSPALAWSGLPEGTKALALIVDDPDAPDPAAPRMTWVHWVLYDLPPSGTSRSPPPSPGRAPPSPSRARPSSARGGRRAPGRGRRA